MKIEVINGDNWQEIWLDGECVWEHHPCYDDFWLKLLARLGHDVTEYDQPLDEHGQFHGTRQQRELEHHYTADEELW